MPLAVIKDDKIVKKKNGGLKVPLFDFSAAMLMLCLDAKILLVSSNNT